MVVWPMQVPDREEKDAAAESTPSSMWTRVRGEEDERNHSEKDQQSKRRYPSFGKVLSDEW